MGAEAHGQGSRESLSPFRLTQAWSSLACSPKDLDLSGIVRALSEDLLETVWETDCLKGCLGNLTFQK